MTGTKFTFGHSMQQTSFIWKSFRIHFSFAFFFSKEQNCVMMMESAAQ
jgi:hypothetical protein